MFPFDGIQRRGRISLAREYDTKIVTIANGESISDEIDFRFAAAMAVSIDANMTGTHLAVYGSAESGGVKRPLYDKDDNLLIVTAEDNGIVALPSEIFPVGYLALASCSDAAGTLETEGGDRVFVVMVKG